MKSDPLDIVAAIKLSKATVRKMKQNLFWAAIYNVLAIPVAAGVFYNPFRLAIKAGNFRFAYVGVFCHRGDQRRSTEKN